MATPSPPSPLADILRAVVRRYRLPDTPELIAGQMRNGPAQALAVAVEQARLALARGEAPGEETKRRFLDALCRLIRDAMREQGGDPVFQAMVLRRRAARVREYASLAAHAQRDRRRMHAAVNAVAHPARRQSADAADLREALAGLRALAASGSWSALREAAGRLAAMPETAGDGPLAQGLARLREAPELDRLQRLESLMSDELVREYQALWGRQGPVSGSAGAAAQGVAAQRRGARVEALAARALRALALRLETTERGRAAYRVATSMRVPATIPGSPDRAKSEWDAVLLRRPATADETEAWEVCLLVEAKASADAAATDLPRLLRGLRLLAQADERETYAFETREGVARLRGASLHALTADEARLAETVLYCCDAPADAAPRLLSAASRMQLLSAPASLAFASALARAPRADEGLLEPVWRQLLTSPQWGGVLSQYPMLRLARGLMVHADDLLAAAGGAASCGSRAGE